MVMVSEDEKFNPASATREIFTQAINRALNDMTDAQIEALVQSAVGTEMSQRQMADLNLQSALETAVSAIRSEMTQKASISDVTAAVADEAAARQAADTTVYNDAAELVTDETAARQSADAELHDAVGVVAALGAKNLFKNDKNAGATVTKQGAIWVFDQTSVEVKVSGNVSGTWSDVFLLNSNFDLSDKEYTIVIESDSPDVFVYITGNTLSGGNIPSNGQYYAGVYRYKGVMTTSTRFTAKTASYSNNTIRCMICPASITDTTYVPYAPTNRELYAMILALQSGVSAQSAASLMQTGRLDPAELTDTQEVTDDA